MQRAKPVCIGVPYVERVDAYNIWAMIDIDRRWRAGYRLVLQDGRPVVGEVRVFPRERIGDPTRWEADKVGLAANVPNGGVRAATLKRVPLRDISSIFEEFHAVCLMLIERNKI